ncbi:MAG: MFS transporter [Rhodospirillaceae bacterium]|nr:MAG: MFS transporter [Rhodospirillaceae bacterium]
MDGQFPDPAAGIAVEAMPAAAAGIGGNRAVSTWFFAMAGAVVVLNLFSAQPLVDVIGPAIGLAPSAYGLVSMLTLLGYAAGLILLVPMVDLTENRRLILQMLVGDVLALTVAALAQQSWIFLAASFALGMTMSVIQMLVPLAASLSPESQRGRVVGNVMSGLMLGIMLSRPLASLIAEYLGWRSVYGLSAIAVALLVVALTLRLPRRRPAPGLSYAALIGSLWTLMRSEKVLRLRAATAGLCFGSFSLFWTAIALRLHAAPFQLSANGLAAFALAGVGGIVMAPLAGRLGDRGWGEAAAVISDLLVIGAMALAWLAGSDGLASHPAWALGLMVAAALLLDLGVVGDQTLGRRAINLLNPAARGRLNGLFTGSFFIGGACGSLAAGAAWVWAGWSLICLLAILAGAAACLLSLLDWFGTKSRSVRKIG